MIRRAQHIGIAVRDIADALTLYRDVLGLEVKKREELPELQLRVAMLALGDTAIELLEPTDPESTVGRFIERRGEGIHHLAFNVDDIDAMLEQLKESGVQLIDEEARRGVGNARVAFIHPRSAKGVLLELVEERKQ